MNEVVLQVCDGAGWLVGVIGEEEVGNAMEEAEFIVTSWKQ